MRSESFLAQRDEVVAVGDNTGCGRSGSGMLEFGFQLESFIYTHAVGCVYTQFRLAQNSTKAHPAGT
jgi:hypothetical protein